MIGLVIGVLVVGALAMFVISCYNSLVRLKQMVKEAFATMDVYMKKRFDLVPNLVETVKGYASHEKDTLEKVIQARNMAMSAGNIEERAAGENMLTGALKSVFALAESYPDLKANTNFMDLQKQLTDIEDDIVNSRKYYNAVVRDYNTSIMVFPRNIIAGMFHFNEEVMFSVDDESERKAVKVEF